MEAASRGRIERARYFAGNRQLFVSFVGMRRQSGGKQSFRIGVERPGTEFEAVGEFDDLSEIHNRDAVADMRHRRQIVPDEKIADPEPLL